MKLPGFYPYNFVSLLILQENKENNPHFLIITGKVVPAHAVMVYWIVRVWLRAFLTSTLGRGAVLLAQNFCMCRLVPCIKLSITILSPAFAVHFMNFVASERRCLQL